MEDIFEYKNYHFIGIGGVSMSALAILLHKMGKNVSGSDCKCQRLEQLKKIGIKVFTKFNISNLKNVDLFVYNYAISNDNPEMLYARENNIPIIDRASFLGNFAKQYNDVISIAGTHGKTTTTAMISNVLLRVGLMPTIHIGGDYDLIGGNCYLGANKYFITEACEFKESFLSLDSTVGIINNIEEEHMDYYKSKDKLIKAFKKFANNSKIVVINNELKDLFASFNTVTFGIDNGDYYAKDLRQSKGQYNFALYKKQEYMGRVKLKVGGKYNVLNALACFACCDQLGIDNKQIILALNVFDNVRRRFELIGNVGSIDIITDYAHHPTEIANAIDVALQKYGKVYCVFQPHTYSRTKTLFDKFIKCFDKVESLAILPTYASREKYQYEGSAEALFEAICNKKVIMIRNQNELNKCLECVDVGCILFVGAGDIIDIAQRYYHYINKKHKKAIKKS